MQKLIKITLTSYILISLSPWLVFAQDTITTTQGPTDTFTVESTPYEEPLTNRQQIEYYYNNAYDTLKKELQIELQAGAITQLEFDKKLEAGSAQIDKDREAALSNLPKEEFAPLPSSQAPKTSENNLLIPTGDKQLSPTQITTSKGYKLIVPIPIPGEAPLTQVTDIRQYIVALYRFGLGIGLLVAMGIIVWAGILYTVSAGNSSKQEDAKDQITNAVYGIALLMGAYLILYTINPALVSLRLTPLQTITVPKVGTSIQDSLSKLEAEIQKNGEAREAAYKEASKFAQEKQVVDAKIATLEEQLKADPSNSNLEMQLVEKRIEQQQKIIGENLSLQKTILDRRTQEINEIKIILGSVGEIRDSNYKIVDVDTAIQGILRSNTAYTYSFPKENVNGNTVSRIGIYLKAYQDATSEYPPIQGEIVKAKDNIATFQKQLEELKTRP